MTSFQVRCISFLVGFPFFKLPAVRFWGAGTCISFNKFSLPTTLVESEPPEAPNRQSRLKKPSRRLPPQRCLPQFLERFYPQPPSSFQRANKHFIWWSNKATYQHKKNSMCCMYLSFSNGKSVKTSISCAQT